MRLFVMPIHDFGFDDHLVEIGLKKWQGLVGLGDFDPGA